MSKSQDDSAIQDEDSVDGNKCSRQWKSSKTGVKDTKQHSEHPKEPSVSLKTNAGHHETWKNQEADMTRLVGGANVAATDNNEEIPTGESACILSCDSGYKGGDLDPNARSSGDEDLSMHIDSDNTEINTMLVKTMTGSCSDKLSKPEVDTGGQSSRDCVHKQSIEIRQGTCTQDNVCDKNSTVAECAASYAQNQARDLGATVLKGEEISTRVEESPSAGKLLGGELPQAGMNCEATVVKGVSEGEIKEEESGEKSTWPREMYTDDVEETTIKDCENGKLAAISGVESDTVVKELCYGETAQVSNDSANECGETTVKSMDGDFSTVSHSSAGITQLKVLNDETVSGSTCFKQLDFDSNQTCVKTSGTVDDYMEQTTVKQAVGAIQCENGDTDVKQLGDGGDQTRLKVLQEGDCMEPTDIKEVVRGPGGGGGAATGEASLDARQSQDGFNIPNDVKQAQLKEPMTNIHKSVIRELGKDFLRQHLSAVYEIVQYLHQELLLTLDEKDSVELAERTDREIAVQKMLEILLCKSEYAYTVLREAIRCTDQYHVLKRLDLCCTQIEETPGQECFDTFRVQRVPSYYVDRKPDVEAVIQMLEQEEVQTVGIVGSRSPDTASEDSDVSDEDSGSDCGVDSSGADIVGIKGWGGVGKTILAIRVCDKMKSKLPVVWLSVGQRPNIVKLFNDLHHDLTGVQGAFPDEDNASNWLRQYSDPKSRNQPFLLILDDVWSLNHAYPFTALGKCNKMLITSRIKSILEDLDATIHHLDPLDAQQSKRLLMKSAKLKSPSRLQDVLNKILELLGGLPLAIVLIGSSLKNKSKLQDWENTYKRMVCVKDTLWKGKKRIPDSVYKYKNIYEAFEVSFQALADDDEFLDDPESGARIQARFLDFALFPDDVNVPSNVLYKLWKHQLSRDTPKDCLEMGRHLEILVDKSFITTAPSLSSDVDLYNIHDLLLDYARYKLCEQDPNALKLAHGHFLECYSKDVVPAGLWWKVRDDGYFYHHIAHHLFEAGHHNELKVLLWNIEWLEQKLFVTDVTGVLADFKMLKRIEEKTEGEVPVTEDDHLLQRSLVLSSHILSPFTDQIYPQLVGRLSGHGSPKIKQLVDDINDYVRSKEAMLMPEAPCLSPPHGYRKQSLRQFSTVTCAAISSNNKYLYIGCADHQLRCIDLASDQIKIMGKEEERHTGMVFTMAMEEAAGYIVTGSFDNNVHVWPIDENSRVTFKCFTGHSDAVFTVATFPERQLVVSGSVDCRICIWDLSTSSCFGKVDNAHVNCVREVAVIGNGHNTIVSVGEDKDGIIKMWDVDTKQIKHSWSGHDGVIYAVRVTPDKTRIVTGGKTDFLLKVWNLKCELLVTCTGHYLDVFRLFITADSKHILSGSLDKTARLWNIETGDLERSFYGHGQAVWALYVSSDNKLAVTGGEDQLAILWNADLSDSVHDPQLKRHNLEVTSLASSPDGHLVVSTARDRTVKVWEWPSMELLHTLDGHSDRVNCVTVCCDPRQPSALRAITGSNDKTMRVWSLSPFQQSPLHIFDKSHKYGITTLCSNSSGRFLFSGSYDNVIAIHDLATFSLLLNVDCHQFSNVRHLAIKDTRLIAALDGSVLSWDLQLLLELAKKKHDSNEAGIPQHTSMCAEDHFSYSSCPRTHMQGFVSGLGDLNKVRMLNIAQLIESRIYTPHETEGDLVTAVYSENTDRFIFTGSLHGNIGCIDRTVQPAKPYEIHRPMQTSKQCKVTAIRVSTGLHKQCVAGYANGDVWAWSANSDVFAVRPNGGLLTTQEGAIECLDMCCVEEKCLVAFGSTDGEQPSIQVWDVPGRRRLFCLRKHTDKVTDLKFVKHGSKLLTSSLDKSVCIWDMADGRLVREDVTNLRYGVLALAIDPKERFYACGGLENVVEIRGFSDGTLLKTLCTNEFYHFKNMYIRENNTIVCAFAREFYVEVDIDSGDILYTGFNMQKENGAVSHVVSPTRVVSGTTHCKAKVWDIKTGQTSHVLDAGSTRALLSACVMECGHVVTGSYDKVVKVWNVTDCFGLVASFAFEHAVMAVHEFRPNHLVVGLLNGQVCFLKLTGGAR